MKTISAQTPVRAQTPLHIVGAIIDRPQIAKRPLYTPQRGRGDRISGGGGTASAVGEVLFQTLTEILSMVFIKLDTSFHSQTDEGSDFLSTPHPSLRDTRLAAARSRLGYPLGKANLTSILSSYGTVPRTNSTPHRRGDHRSSAESEAPHILLNTLKFAKKSLRTL